MANTPNVPDGDRPEAVDGNSGPDDAAKANPVELSDTESELLGGTGIELAGGPDTIMA